MARVFSCEYCEIYKNICFTKHLWTTASKPISGEFEWARWNSGCGLSHPYPPQLHCSSKNVSNRHKIRLSKAQTPKPSVFLLFRTNYLVGYFCPNLPQMFQQRFPHRHLIWLLGQKGRTIQPDDHGNTRSNGKEGKLLFTWATSLYLAMHIYKYYLHLKWQLYGKTLNMS